MWVYNCCAWASVCMGVCGTVRCITKKQRQPLAHKLNESAGEEKLNGTAAAAVAIKKRNKPKDIEIKNSWAPQQKQQQHDWRRLEALYMTICMHRFIYVHHTIYELVCVCVYTLQLSLSLRLRLFVFAQTTDNRLFNHKEQIPPLPPPTLQQQQQILRNNSDESYADFCL